VPSNPCAPAPRSVSLNTPKRRPVETVSSPGRNRISASAPHAVAVRRLRADDALVNRWLLEQLPAAHRLSR
jgi:hypothetical protein